MYIFHFCEHPYCCSEGFPLFCRRHWADNFIDDDCCWCGGEIINMFANRRGEVFCSALHRAASNRALKRLLDKPINQIGGVTEIAQRIDNFPQGMK